MNLRLSQAGSLLIERDAPFISAQDQLSYRPLPPAGQPVRIQNAEGDFLAWALSEGPGGAGCWVLTRERQAALDEPWWKGKVQKALTRRQGMGLHGPARLVHGPADGLPGFWADMVDGQGFVRSAPWLGEPYLGWIEAALLPLGHLRGLWRLGPDGAWHPSPRAAHSPAEVLAQEGPLKLALKLNLDPYSEMPPWPLQRRSVRSWLAAAVPGKRLFCFGLPAGEEGLIKLAQPLELAVAPDLFAALPKLAPAGVDLAILQVPAEAKASFGHFDARRNGMRLLKDLGAALAPGAQVLLASGHAGLGSAEAWKDLWQQAGLGGGLVQALGPEPDLPGSPPGAFLFKV